jgi:plasmid stabilization system protein ParE
MKSLPVFALPEVEIDLRNAIAHYVSWRSDGAEHLSQKYGETVSWIAWNPEAFPRKYGPVRRAILKQSYYIIYFLLERDRTVIVAVLDGRRDPREIRALLAKRKSRISEGSVSQQPTQDPG